MHNLGPEGLDPYPQKKPTWAMVKCSANTLSNIDPWSEKSVMVQQRTERLPEAGTLPGPK